MSKESICSDGHTSVTKVGESFRYSSSSEKGGPMDIYWCKNCGAIGRKLCYEMNTVWERHANEQETYVV